MIDISVVIPFLNEEGSLDELYEQLIEVLRSGGFSYELLFIDDGSTDLSNGIVRKIRRENENVKLFAFRINQGKSAALEVGFQAAQGKYVVTMDADLQDDPREIPKLIEKLESGFDLVSGWKKIRHDPFTKTLPSKVFNGFISRLSGIKLHDFNCGLKIYRNEVVKNLSVYGERHRFLPVLAHMLGFRVSELAVLHHPRKHGKTKFGAYRYLAGFLDTITLVFRMRFLTKPMHLFGSLGMASLFSGLAIVLYLMIGWFQGIWIGNRPLFMIGILGIIAGVQLLTLGLLAEMIVEKSKRSNIKITMDTDLDSDSLP